jgi:hypothetical protein
MVKPPLGGTTGEQFFSGYIIQERKDVNNLPKTFATLIYINWELCTWDKARLRFFSNFFYPIFIKADKTSFAFNG